MVKVKILIFAAIVFFFASGAAAAGIALGPNGPQINGFIENDFGLKLGNDRTKRDNFNLFEQRLQLETRVYPEQINLLKEWMPELEVKGNFTVDEYFNGRTDAQLRSCNLTLVPQDDLDLKIGRQILTWGTGDYLFINDLFPKDYESFFVGREDEYLKKPSDAAKVSWYAPAGNLDLIVIPEFEPNTIFNGQRLSFFDSFAGGIAGVNSDRKLIEPNDNPEHAEYAARVYRNFDNYETAIYLFRGQDKMPSGYLNEQNRELFYPRLDVYGTSLRGPGFGGVVNFEFGFYNSRQDEKGDNRLISNSKTKYLAGYSKDLGNDLNLGLQYFFEQTLNYDNYLRALSPNDFVWDECRHLTTLRLTKLYKNQTVRVNLFTFFSPSDMDVYTRPSIDYDINDDLRLTFGANLAWGKDTHTEFGQMEQNKNIYTRLRYSF